MSLCKILGVPAIGAAGTGSLKGGSDVGGFECFRENRVVLDGLQNELDRYAEPVLEYACCRELEMCRRKRQVQIADKQRRKVKCI